MADRWYIAISGGLLFLHGGRSNFVLDDVFVLDLVTKTWSEVVVAGGRASPSRHAHISAVHADRLYIYGGLNELGTPSDQMLALPAPNPDTNLTTFR